MTHFKNNLSLKELKIKSYRNYIALKNIIR